MSERVEKLDWDGNWWADALEGHDVPKFEAFVRRLECAPFTERRQIAKEIFQFGHEHGHNLCRDLSWED